MISLADIYNKNVNFLLGSGASLPLFPTLALDLNRSNDEQWTLEELATHFEETDDSRKLPLFMHYYVECIEPAQKFSLAPNDVSEVITNYRTFLKTVLDMLQRRKELDRRCNIFTTNYDGCIPLVADEILREGEIDFVLNDGAKGFSKRFLQASNFSSFLCQTGVFDRHQSSIPQINLIHLHGSVYWLKDGQRIAVNYAHKFPELLDQKQRQKLAPFSEKLRTKGATLDDLAGPIFDEKEAGLFWASYNALPIVNPTKWKFHETVFEEHYYQMLRLLSYELEKPNAVLISFGFSFADEHILHLVKRSLSNPRLEVFVCCFNKGEYDRLHAQFKTYSNVKCVAMPDYEKLRFTEFNNSVLTHSESRAEFPVSAHNFDSANSQGPTNEHKA